ncbi:hypothetical protein AX769_19955 [Frondihabitans sp. PAMC 28766]|uniref:ATP-binding cassette domain-containing protein n=1 Tax=Frondihabitans sp. PAMC 28766 TaxID=1795630 RepID=UPI00078B75BB|nr:ATP-binding cassette domain-containing protein [Frondihabitans sp. PAMC 28766]AMM22005.1 hypothetical protein AX769_19955 [Frondihabitans sp. PAMC 28766]
MLNDLSFAVSGGVHAILGPNGAGKSTLLRILAGLAKAQSGDVGFEGVSLGDRRGTRIMRRWFGYQPQTPVFNNGFTVRESVGYAAWLKGMGARQAPGLIDRALEATHLRDVKSMPVGRLSGGQQKRAAIAQAIVHQPRLLLLDEPTAALDPSERRSILDVIDHLGRESTVLLSTHITSDLRVADSVLVLTDGQARFSGPKMEFGQWARADDADIWESAYDVLCEKL